MAEILIVDDERVLREGLRRRLAGEGHCVRTARDGEEALQKIGERRPDLVLLDVMMPKMNGFRCCEEIRKTDPLLPVVFLTAKFSDVDQVRGIGLGGDDYVSKDASDAVLDVRIERAVARAGGLRRRLADEHSLSVRLGETVVDLQTYAVTEGGREIACLTKTEADLLRYLDGHRGELFSTDDLITELRGNGFACADNMLCVHVYNLRRKLGAGARRLVHRRGVGYGLV